MTQRTLEMEPAVIEAEIVEPTQYRALAVIRDQNLSVSPDELRRGFEEYDASRKVFIDWLMSHLVEGRDYGYPPGCQPQFDARGWVKCGRDFVDPKQWMPKKSLYKSGALICVSLMQWIDVYEPDLATWEMLGKPAGTMVVACRLYVKGRPHTSENLRGMGRGARVLGQKGGDANNSVKMGDKCGLSAAVINGLSLSHFTQDLGDPNADGKGPPPASENPTAKATPATQPRGEGVSKEELASLTEQFKATRMARGLSSDRAAFAEWVESLTDMADSKQRSVTAAGSWQRDDYRTCCTAIAEESSGGIPF